MGSPMPNLRNNLAMPVTVMKMEPNPKPTVGDGSGGMVTKV